MKELGAIAGAMAGAFVARLVRPMFASPAGAIGYITVHHYPKDWDLAVAALIVAGSFAGALIGRGGEAPSPVRTSDTRPRWLVASLAVFVLVVALDDRPFAALDFYHDGEHLTGAFLLRSGSRPYRDAFFSHGFAADGGLDALVLGDPPAPPRVWRARAILGAAALALIAPIAAEVCATSGGVVAATLASFCAVGAGLLTLFSYFRLAPILVAALALLRYLRTRRALPLAVAMFASTLGVLWSLDVGLFALTGTILAVAAIHAAGLGGVRWPKLATIAIAAAAAPLIVLLAVRADLRGFVTDSLVTMPRIAWIVWSLPQPDPPHLDDFWYWLADDPARYYVPLIVDGLALGVAVRQWRRGDRVNAARIATLVVFALLLFRSAAGRVDANHVRFALPFFGILAVAVVVEPLAMRGRLAGTIAASLVFVLVCDVVPNVTGAVDALRGWPARHRPDGSVPVPLRAARQLFEPPQVAADLATLNAYVESLGANAEILVASNDRALYALLERKTPAHYLDIMMWSSPPLFAGEMARLRARPPACVIVAGYAENAFDGISNEERVPGLWRWIDANYPRRMRFGRFIVASR